jgi:glycyl-tRNA synthetase beta chain
MNTQDFLLELGCEELPPKGLQQLSNALTQYLTAEFDKLRLSYSSVESFATPRRLAVLVSHLQLQQNNQTIERKGPSISAPDQAIEGFAKSCGVAKNALAQKAFGKTQYYFFTKQQKGLKTIDLLESAVATAIQNIPIAKPMRWSDLDTYFVRPTHWLIMLLGSDIVPASMMGLTSGNTTRGLRFTGEPTFDITCAKNYQKTLLEKAQIEVDFNTRKEMIRRQVIQVAKNNNAMAVIDESLLNEVCALVEYPRVFSGSFSSKFLDVPKEVLISAMKSHQKYFHMLDAEGNLMPAFISVANIESSDLSVIIDGNERVIRPRLADSEFFWRQDKAHTLESRLDKLNQVLFMKSLGSMGDKSKRIGALSGYIAGVIGANVKDSTRAGLLCKSDLVTDMVGEFADLQGVMGGYYALNDGENQALAAAISEHYHPRFSGDSLPSTPEGLCVAIADKVDSIVGIYGIGHKPTGSKDPYALKRAGLGLLRMIIESESNLDLLELTVKSATFYDFDINIATEINAFILGRLIAYYQEQGIHKTIVKAAQEKTDPSQLYDLNLRIKALYNFVQDKASKSLIKAHKRVANIFKDNDCPSYNCSLELEFTINDELVKFSTNFDEDLVNALQRFQDVTEYKLSLRYSQKTGERSSVSTLSEDYLLIMRELLKLKPAIDDFFDNVMVVDDNLEVRNSRLVLVDYMAFLLDSIANFSYLSK